jgi:hydrogenase expression/formation protein HypC
MQVIEGSDFSARCVADGKEAMVDLSLVGPQDKGAWLLVFLGSAREVLSPEDARRIRDAHTALRAAMAGGSPDIDHLFADLVNREPELPPSLMTPEDSKTA